MRDRTRAARGPGPTATRSAFRPESVTEGAVVTVDGGRLVTTSDEIVVALESALVDGAAESVFEGGWLSGVAPLIVRDAAWIIPLSWVPSAHDGHDDAHRELRTRADLLWSEIGMACDQQHGNQIGIDLSAPESAYARELNRTGARRADWWRFGESAVVRVVYADPLPAPMSRIALHVVPHAWVWETAPSKAKKTVDPTDLDWSWSDVVALEGDGRGQR